jgi:hypothetical protein
MAKFLSGSSRQLTDLRIMPSMHDPRPAFYPSSDLPATEAQAAAEAHEASGGGRFPCLRWHPVTGTEVAAKDALALADYESRGYVSYPPHSAAVSPLEAIKDELASLTPEEHQMVVEAQRKSRMDAIQKKLSALSADDLDRALEGAAEQVKRGPGRPRKLA